MYMSGNRLQRQWLIMAARELELMPTTEGGLDYRLNMTHAIDGYPGIEHSMPHRPGVRRRGPAVQHLGYRELADLARDLRRTVGRELFYTNEDVIGDEKLAHFTPKEELNFKIRRRNPGPGPVPGSGRRVRVQAPLGLVEGPGGGWRQDGRRQPRAATGLGLPLGALGPAGRRWNEQS